MHGVEQKINHRSNAERGIELEPQPKRGTNINDMEFRVGNNPKDLFSAATTEKAITFPESKLRNVCRIIRRPEIVLDIVSKHHATFMWGDVEKVLNRYIDDLTLYQQLEQKLKSSKELVLLRYEPVKNKDGSIEDHSIYTTRSIVESEINLVQLAERLNKAKSHEDYVLYQEWRDLKMACSDYMKQNLEECRPLMKELGVDPQHFAEQFVDKDMSLKEQKLEAAALVHQWQLPQLDPYQRKHICELREETKKALIQEWYQSFTEHPEKSHLIMTYSKADTAMLNEEALTLIKRDGIVAKKEYLHIIHKEDEDDFGGKITTKEEKYFAKGDRILFLKNHNGLGVKNGTL